ncbi:hypothetical protein [Pontibacter sp. HSC-36F09]|uniref:hypothetical protein n=1 Tax=Pontibacter sp. HSC-36F09 TaxID=2910966 RepID=UPI0020A0F39B|nr:hypothetical protein [Pontibacter sp. HSC-36F09]MCP2042299.1 hypothetical protein [Pontibacter sp. HSC-36F09]
MKYASLLCVLCLVLLANTCRKKAEAEFLGQTWLHSYEEDEDDVLVYRPNTYDFPPSRGRTGFALEQEGVAKQYAIAPADGLEEHIGIWEYKDKNTIRVHIQGNGYPEQRYTMEVVSLKDNVLKVRIKPEVQDE